MLRFIRWLFGSDETNDSERDAAADRVTSSSRSRGRSVSDAYFGSMQRLQTAIAKRDYENAARHVHHNLHHMTNWVREFRREHRSFDISSIPALQQGGTILALVGDDEGLARMREIVASVQELEPWAEAVERHLCDRRLFAAILELIGAQPNCLQTDVKGLIGEKDGRRVANLISYLDKAGKIVRIKSGRTYRLLPPDSPAIPKPPSKRIVRSHRIDSNPPNLHEIDISSVNYVPLPRSPAQGSNTGIDSEWARIPDAAEPFEVYGTNWKISAVQKLPLAQRPDTAFRKLHPTDSGLFMIDDLGKADDLGVIKAAALRYNRSGELAAKKGFQHGIYRIGVHPLGRGLIAMSRDCVLHAYDDRLRSVLETTLADAPEIVALRRRFEIPDGQVKNHIRCVAISRDANRYLFTAADEAWCVEMNGRGAWGVKLPHKEGWTRIATPSDGFGTSADVDNALALMGLSLPITPEDLKQRYRNLAKRWHPDRNPADAQAEERTKALNAAAEVLTGVDARTLEHYTGSTFGREVERTEIEAGGIRFTLTTRMQATEIQVADWIYAASFAGGSDAAYLAGTSGRVVHVDDKGKAVRVYDIGGVPRKIVDTGDYLYLMTGTRLYVLRNDTLHSLVDTYDDGDLVIAQTAFGLLEKKRLRWFREDGRYLGSVVSKDPIRRVYSTGDRMAVETRRQRAIVEGVPTWWE
ncbi:MAG: DnaJ domain-containing protein [Bryobacterales bacterium]|nr:DnaJ domain-containing protein [Bryobacterales bacterium]